MTTLAFPTSELVRQEMPFKALLRIGQEIADEKLSLSLKLKRESSEPSGPTLSAQCEILPGEAAFEVAILAEDLAEGDYTGELTLAGEKTQTCWPFHFPLLDQTNPGKPRAY